MLDDTLGRVLGVIDGGRCVVLTAADGMVVASARAHDAPPADVVAATFAGLFRTARELQRDSGLAPPKELTLGGASGQTVLRAITNDYLLVAVLDGAGGVGRTRFELRKAAAELEGELS